VTALIIWWAWQTTAVESTKLWAFLSATDSVLLGIENAGKLLDLPYILN
jgi:hypothetical protein